MKLEFEDKLKRYKDHVFRRWVLLSAVWVYVLGYIFELYMRYFG
jgi:hypothetical protein